METRTQPSSSGIDETAALRAIVEGTATETGGRFFERLVEYLARALGTHGAWVTEYLPETRELRALALWLGGGWVPDWKMAIDDTFPNEAVDRFCARAHDMIVPSPSQHVFFPQGGAVGRGPTGYPIPCLNHNIKPA